MVCVSVIRATGTVCWFVTFGKHTDGRIVLGRNLHEEEGARSKCIASDNPMQTVASRFRTKKPHMRHKWQPFVESHGLEGGISRRRNWLDNAVTEVFLSSNA